MKNLFSSPALQDFQKFITKQLDYLLNEQKHQRGDLAQILRLLHKKESYYNPSRISTLDEYETSHQTDSEEQFDEKEPD